jgi:hypothetical protein
MESPRKAFGLPSGTMLIAGTNGPCSAVTVDASMVDLISKMIQPRESS